MLPDVFWSLTWPEYERLVHGYHLRQARQWEHTRALLVQQVNIGRGSKGKYVAPEKYMPLLTDKPRQAKAKDADDLRAFRDRMKQELQPKN